MQFLSDISLFSKKEGPKLYIVPVKRKITDSKDSNQNNVKITYADFEMKLPFKKILDRHDSDIYKKTTTIWPDTRKGNEGVFITISDSLSGEEENGETKSFESYGEMLSITPDQVKLEKLTKKYLRLDDENHKKFSMLIDKLCLCISFSKIYKFDMSNVRGFKFIDFSDKDKSTTVEIFDRKNRNYNIEFCNFSQREINYSLATVRFKK
jgi:hypothetical protein